MEHSSPSDVAQLKAAGDVTGLIAMLECQDRNVRRAAALALGEIGGTQAVEPLLQALQGKRWDASTALIAIGSPAVEPLIAAFWRYGPPMHAPIVRILGHIGDARAAGLLVEALGDRERDVCVAATYALARIGYPAVEPLIAALENAAVRARCFAASVLADIGGPRAVEPLLAALQQPDMHVRESAVLALGKIGGPRVVEPLIAVLQDKFPLVRQTASQTLGQLRDRRAVKPLCAVLQSDSASDVRKAAAGALSRLWPWWLPGRNALGAIYWITRGKWFPCVLIGRAALEPLLLALEDGGPIARECAARALIWLYRLRFLNRRMRQRILAETDLIRARHTDYYRGSCMDFHVDSGIRCDW